MCGFVCIINRTPEAVDQGSIERMLHVIRHRGPDDAGYYFSAEVGFGFRRLAILDLTPAGHQPMSTIDGRFTIVFNGEIYNYVELRSELLSLGHRFSSGSDTEVLLHAYVEWGEECLRRLNGMWAFLIHDRQRQIVFGARDRFGMKPLYWHVSSTRILIASEIKSIRVSGQYEESIDWRVCAKFFYEQKLDDSNDTFFGGIQSFPAGNFFEVDLSNRKITTKQYWNFSQEIIAPINCESTFGALFEDAVRVHLRSDVPVGVNLSGGLDSTAIICAIKRERESLGSQMPIEAFCFTSKEYDESAYLAATLACTGAHQNILTLGAKDLWSSLATVLWFQDEPVHSITAVVGFHLSKMAARNSVKVVVNGQGADETLGGYPSYFRDLWFSLVSQNGLKAAKNEIEAYCAVHGGGAKQLLGDLLVHLLKSSLRRSSIYRNVARRRQLANYRNNDWFDRELVTFLPDSLPYESGDLNSTLARAVRLDPLPLYLRIEDRNAMAHSVEARLPFLDPRLVEFSSRLPPLWKLRGPWNKFILREAMRGRIPENVRTRPDKMGFPTPFANWLRKELYQPALDILNDPDFKSSGVFNVGAIKRDLERHRNGEIDISGRIFDVLQFHLWRQISPLVVPI